MNKLILSLTLLVSTSVMALANNIESKPLVSSSTEITAIQDLDMEFPNQQDSVMKGRWYCKLAGVAAKILVKSLEGSDDLANGVGVAVEEGCNELFGKKEE